MLTVKEALVAAQLRMRPVDNSGLPQLRQVLATCLPTHSSIRWISLDLVSCGHHLEFAVVGVADQFVLLPWTLRHVLSLRGRSWLLDPLL